MRIRRSYGATAIADRYSSSARRTPAALTIAESIIEHDVLGALRSAFPTDRIDHHGRRGDVLQVVMHGDREIGRILYECKNAGAWQNAWLTETAGKTAGGAVRPTSFS